MPPPDLVSQHLHVFKYVLFVALYICGELPTPLSIDSLIQGLNQAELRGYVWSGSTRSHLDYKLCMHILLRLCMYIIIYKVCLHVHMYVQYVCMYVDTYLLLFFVASNNHLCIN